MRALMPVKEMYVVVNEKGEYQETKSGMFAWKTKTSVMLSFNAHVQHMVTRVLPGSHESMLALGYVVTGDFGYKVRIDKQDYTSKTISGIRQLFFDKQKLKVIKVEL
jgi:hypothetical protein